MDALLVSIHALLAECDCFRFPGGADDGSFNPRTPCGVRPDKIAWFPFGMEFQSTHSLRSATGVLFCTVPRPPVSIHALLAECDAVVAVVAVGSGGFNPRTPCGVRLTFRRGQIVAVDVSIHALLAECDRQKRIVTGRDMEFQSTHSLRSATQKCYLNPRNPRFQSTHSLRSATPRYAKPGSKNVT